MLSYFFWMRELDILIEAEQTPLKRAHLAFSHNITSNEPAMCDDDEYLRGHWFPSSSSARHLRLILVSGCSTSTFYLHAIVGTLLLSIFRYTLIHHPHSDAQFAGTISALRSVRNTMGNCLGSFLLLLSLTLTALVDLTPANVRHLRLLFSWK